MPAVFRRLLVIAAFDGLILQPLHNKSARALQIDYKSQNIHNADTLSGRHESHVSLECHGIVGLLTIAPKTYLIAISGRQEVAQVRGAPVYVITNVAFIPTTTQGEAKQAISQAKQDVKRAEAAGDLAFSDSDISEEEEDGHSIEQESGSAITASSPSDGKHETTTQPQQHTQSKETGSSSVAEDVIQRRGQYGRFTERWFSKKGWTADRIKSLGMSSGGKPTPESSTEQLPGVRTPNSGGGLPSAADKDDLAKAKAPPSITSTLVPKILRTSHLLLSSRSFFFSFDTDITRRLGTSPTKSNDIPLHKSVDPLYFWNRHLALPFIERGDHGFVVPIMQGFVGQKTFEIQKTDDSEPTHRDSEGSGVELREIGAPPHGVDKGSFLITLISRRSTKRPGLRYVRRGVDDEGYTANTVETEQLLSQTDWSGKIYSFTQIRGSIPLFFSQSPYAFKPVPMLHQSAARNQLAFDRHFNGLQRQYGEIQVASLIEKTGGEAPIGQRYEENAKRFNEQISDQSKKLGFEWFDFHQVCRGMRFENISILVNTIGKTLDRFGNTIQSGEDLISKQTGVLRTNCMDCLDRTNVVQSACGQWALEAQLEKEGFSVDLRTDATTQWFNNLWADNGDAISKQYSSTAALKGDYTRTRRRNYRGAINDLGLTISRYYNNIVNDYFSQATIDFLLGNVTDLVFEEFEDKLMSGDPGMSVQRVRENAISTCAKIVIEDGSEDMLGGWILLSPSRPDVLVALPLEEVVLLLTDVGLYKVRFDWNDDKVISFERVDLRSITRVTKGAYITSTFTAAQMDESRNVGFVVRYHPGRENVARVNTRSLSTAMLPDAVSDTSPDTSPTATSNGDKILALKALPARSTFVTEGEQPSPPTSETDSVSHVCEEIQRAAMGTSTEGSGFIEERAIVSLQEAKKNTGLVDQLGHALKRFVWG